jgi:uncharacterized pyridoxal phosphate-containing UPF0001 family protein
MKLVNIWKTNPNGDKWEEMPKDIQWHMMGHVKTNKSKVYGTFVS